MGEDAQPESGEPCLPLSSLSKEAWLEAGHRLVGIKTHGLGSIPGPGRSPAERNCNPLQYSCLENPMDRGAWQSTIKGIAQSLK